MIRRVFITGANSGLGFELAKQYIKRGDDVALFDIRFSQQSKHALRTLSDDSQYIEFFAVDMADTQTLAVQVNNAVVAIGEPEVAIYCPSTTSTRNIESLVKHSDTNNDCSQQANIIRTLNFSAVIRQYLTMNSHLALITSHAPMTPFEYVQDQRIADDVILNFAKTQRQELKPDGIKVSVIYAPETPYLSECDQHNCAHTNTKIINKVSRYLTQDRRVTRLMRGLDKQKFMVILGFQSRLSYSLSRYLPSWMMAPVMKRIIKHSNKNNMLRSPNEHTR